MIYGPYIGVVNNVHDGDTIDIKLDLGFDLTVYARCRVFGIDAPELKTDAGKAARDYAMTLLPVGSTVMVHSHGWDKYGGRIDADIEYDSHMLNFASAMIDSGHAVAVKY